MGVSKDGFVVCRRKKAKALLLSANLSIIFSPCLRNTSSDLESRIWSLSFLFKCDLNNQGIITIYDKRLSCCVVHHHNHGGFYHFADQLRWWWWGRSFWKRGSVPHRCSGVRISLSNCWVHKISNGKTFLKLSFWRTLWLLPLAFSSWWIYCSFSHINKVRINWFRVWKKIALKGGKTGSWVTQFHI